MTVKRVKLDTINVSDFAYTEIMHQILYSIEARSNSGCLMGELIGVSGHSNTTNRSHIEIENAVVRYSNVTIKVKKGKVIIYADMTYIENHKFKISMLDEYTFMRVPRYIREVTGSGRILSIIGYDLVAIHKLTNSDIDLANYSDMMTEILSNGMANRLANWSDSLVKDWDINPTNDLYAYHKSLIHTDDMLIEFHTAIILDYTDMVSILIKKEK